MAKKVFISGPIQGVEKNQSYRKRIGSLLAKYGYETVDPWEREKIHYELSQDDRLQSFPKDFIRRDLEDIDKCDIFVVYLPRLSAGACMELFYAKLRKRKTITICRLKNPSPWIVAHSDIIVKNLEEFERILKKGI